MAKKKPTARKRKKRRQLSVFERTKISLKWSEGWSIRRIGRFLKRPPSTISREIERNASGEKQRRYDPERAHKKAMERKDAHGTRPLLKTKAIREYVVDKLKLGWSPEQISIRLPIDHQGLSISPEAIYQYIYAQVRRGGNGTVKKGCEDLRPYLARRHTRRQKKGFRQAQKAERPLLPSIEDRPSSVEKRKEIGHWEDDTMVSRESIDRLKSINERVSGVVLLGKMRDGTIEESNRVVIERLKEFPPELRKTLTRDRGSENFGWREIEEALGLDCFFAHAYCSQERGSNENLNGLVRRVYPKKTDFRNITDAELRQLEHRLNTRPRKRHGGLTPLEILFKRTGVALAY